MTLGVSGQASLFSQLMDVQIPTNPKIEGLLYWPKNDSEGHCWDSGSIFYRYASVESDNQTKKISGMIVAGYFGLDQW